MLEKVFKKKEAELVKPKGSSEIEKQQKEADEKKQKIAKRVKKDFALLQEVAKIQPKNALHPFVKLGAIIMKNFRLLIRSRISSLVLFFGPLIIVFLVCMAFNTSSLYGVNIAAYSEEYSSLSDSLIQNLSSKDYYVVKMESKQDCIDSVKFGNFQLCVVFPAKMIVDNSARNTIDMYVDSSRLNIANQLTELLSSRVSLQASEISTGMVSQMLGIIDKAKAEIQQKKVSMDKLSSGNSEISSKVDYVVSEFGGFDFSYSALSTASILAEISDLEDDLNVSSTGFDNLKVLVSALQSQYNSLGKKMDEAKSYSEIVKADTLTLKSYVNANDPYIKDVKSSLDSLGKDFDSIKITKATNIVTPFQTRINSINQSRNYLMYLVAPLLVLLVMFVSLLMSSTSVIREKMSSAYFRNFITPTNDGLFMLGQYLTDVTIIMVQIAIMLGVVFYFLPGLSFLTYVLVGLILVLVSTVFIFLGMILGYLFNTNESVTVASISFGSAFLFFSNSILPLETLSGFMRKLVVFNPFVIGERILRRVFLFNADLGGARNLILMLVVFVIYFLILAVVAREVTKRMTHLSR